MNYSQQMTPTRPARAKNMRLIGHSDLAGYGDGMQIMLKEPYLYVGHLSRMGTTILDVSDPADPQVVRQIPHPPNTHTHKVQLADDLLLVNWEQYGSGGAPPRAGIQILDVSSPTEPREIGFFSTGGKGVHRIWWTGGRYAYFSATPEGFSDRIWMIADLADPERPQEVARWWLPGMWLGGGEQPWWPAERRIAAHHALTQGDKAYLGFGDAGVILLDISDPSQPHDIARVAWAPEGGGHTHTAMPLPERGLLVVTDEAIHPDCLEARRFVRLIDIHDEHRPNVISKCPEPGEEFCDHGLRYGPHNLHENRPGTFISDQIIFVTYFNAGLRVYDISQEETPVEIAHYLPATPPGQKAIQTNDVLVAENGLIYISDRVNGGVDILELTV